MNGDGDIVDESIEDWRRERPELDASSMGVVSRVLMLSHHLERSVNQVLAVYGLELWQLDVLATLRRVGPPFALSAGRLTRSVFLSSGAMTHRIDRLEQSGWVVRQPDPHDRRGVLISLTDKGRKLVDEAIGARFTEADESVRSLSPSDLKTLTDLLRTLLAPMVERKGRTTTPPRQPPTRE